MKIRMTTYKHFILSKSELEMLKTMEIHRQAECNKHSSCRSCPFRDTFFCLGERSIAEMMENSREIKLTVEVDDEQ